MRSSVKHTAISIALFLILSICGLAAGNAVNPAGTARFVVRACAMFEDLWPFSRGGGAPLRIVNVLYIVGILKPVPVKVGTGFLMELDARDWVARFILRDSVWEPPITGVILAGLPEGSVFVDVGANIGYYSLVASAQVGPTGKVIAIEPNPPTVQRLRHNITLNQSTNIVVESVACTANEGQIEFFQAPVYNTGMSSLSTKNATTSEKITVRGLPLDMIIKSQELRRVDLVKIDVEGAEMQVLRGMKEIMATYRPVIITELQPSLLSNMGSSMDEVLEWFRQAGYRRARPLGDRDYLWVPDPAWRRSQ